MYGGITYTIHVREPIGQRVTDIKVGNEPLISDKTYTICVNNYRAVGGGNYDMFAEAPVVKDIQEEGAQLLLISLPITIYLTYLKFLTSKSNYNFPLTSFK